MLKLNSQDSYQIYCQGTLSEAHVRVLHLLYQPIASYQAISLYMTLYSELERRHMLNIESTHFRLVAMMQMKIEDIENAAGILEGLGLMHTYLREEKDHRTLAYELLLPLDASDFFQNELLNVLLYRSLGEMDYEKTRYAFSCPPLDRHLYRDVTRSFGETFHIDLDSSEGLGVLKRQGIYEKQKQQIPQTTYDLDTFYDGLGNYQIPRKAITQEVEAAICQLGMVYHISPSTMRELVYDVLDQGKIEVDSLSERCKRFYEFESTAKTRQVYQKPTPKRAPAREGGSMREKKIRQLDTLSPYDYLRALQKGAAPTARDLGLIENMLVKQQLPSGVVNVIVETVLRLNQGALPRNHVEYLAGLFSRKGIRDTKAALAEASAYIKERQVSRPKEKPASESVSQHPDAKAVADFQKAMENILGGQS